MLIVPPTVAPCSAITAKFLCAQCTRLYRHHSCSLRRTMQRVSFQLPSVRSTTPYVSTRCLGGTIAEVYLVQQQLPAPYAQQQQQQQPPSIAKIWPLARQGVGRTGYRELFIWGLQICQPRTITTLQIRSGRFPLSMSACDCHSGGPPRQ